MLYATITNVRLVDRAAARVGTVAFDVAEPVPPHKLMLVVQQVWQPEIGQAARIKESAKETARLLPAVAGLILGRLIRQYADGENLRARLTDGANEAPANGTGISRVDRTIKITALVDFL